MVDIRQLNSLNEVFSAVMKQIFLTPASSTEAQNEVTWAQQKVLMLLHEHGPMKMSDVARNISVTMPAATAIVDKMVRAGQVQREPDPQDRRVIRIVLSDAGRQLLVECMQTQSRCFEEVLENLDAAKREELLSAFERIHILLGEIRQNSTAAAAAGAGK